MGSKRRIADELIKVMFNGIELKRYIEPFVGGCGIMDKVKCGIRIGIDSNPYLIAMWRGLQNGYRFPNRISREMYARQREYYHDTKSKVSDYNADDYDVALCGWVGFMGSFNGRFYDGGYSGHEVSSNGEKPRDYIGENIRNTMAQVPLIGGVEFICADYAWFEPQPGDLIYADPPYKNTKKYLYSINFDYDRFWNQMKEWSKKDGVDVFVSEYEAPEEFEAVWEKKRNNAMSLRNTKLITEKLFKIKE